MNKYSLNTDQKKKSNLIFRGQGACVAAVWNMGTVAHIVASKGSLKEHHLQALEPERDWSLGLLGWQGQNLKRFDEVWPRWWWEWRLAFPAMFSQAPAYIRAAPVSNLIQWENWFSLRSASRSWASPRCSLVLIPLLQLQDCVCILCWTTTGGVSCPPPVCCSSQLTCCAQGICPLVSADLCSTALWPVVLWWQMNY